MRWGIDIRCGAWYNASCKTTGNRPVTGGIDLRTKNNTYTMKVNYIIAVMLAVATTAFAGQSVVPAPSPAVSAPYTPAWGVELAGVYNWGMNKPVKNEIAGKHNHINGVGGDITGVYNIDESNAVTLRFGYTWGGDKFAVIYDGWDAPVSGDFKETIHTFTIMPGYRYTHAINDKWSVYAGANVGVACELFRMEETVFDDTARAHGHGWGFAYSVEVGGRYAIDTNWDVFAALTFSGNTATAKVKYDGETVAKGAHHNYIGVRAGVGFKF